MKRKITGNIQLEGYNDLQRHQNKRELIINKREKQFINCGNVRFKIGFKPLKSSES